MSDRVELSTSLVNVGLIPNDGNGDNIRDAFIITNENVTSIKNFLEIGPTFSNVLITDILEVDSTVVREERVTHQLSIEGNIASSTVNNGALTVSGGIGVTGNVNVGGRINGDLYSNNIVSGALLVTGGAGVAGQLQAGSLAVSDNVVINGSLTVLGNVSTVTTSEFKVVDPLIEIGGGVTADGTPIPLTSDDGKSRGIRLFRYDTAIPGQVEGFFGVSADEKVFTYKQTDAGGIWELGPTHFGHTTVSSLTSVGSTILSNTEISSLTVTGNLTGTLSTNAQPNITSVGKLNELTVDGNITSTNGDIHVNAGHSIYVNGVSVALTSQAFTGGVVPNSTLFNSGEASTSSATGAVRVNGGIGITGNAYIDGALTTSTFTAATLGGTLVTANQPNISSVGTLGNLSVAGQITSTSASLNSLVVSSSVSCSTMSATTGIAGIITTTAQPNITSVGTLTSLDVTNSVTANVASLNYLTVTNTIDGSISGSADTVRSSSQPAITSLGTLSSLNVSGALTAGSIDAGSGIITTDGNITTTANVEATNLKGTLLSANQPYISAVGTLSSLNVNGTTNLSSNVVVNQHLTVGSGASITGEITTSSLTASGIVTAAGFVGPFSGNVTGNVSGTSYSTTNVAVTSSASPTTCYPTFVGASTGDLPITVNSSRLTFVPLTGVLSATQFSGSGAGLTSIPATALTNNSVTVTAGTGLSGGGTVALGGTVTLNNAGVTSLSGGGGITVNVSTGAVTLGSNSTANNTSNTIVARDASGNFSAGTITATLTGTASNALQLNGHSASTTAGTANRIVQADASGYINTSYISSTDGPVTTGVTAIMVKTGDNYLRSGDSAAVLAYLGLSSSASTASSSSNTPNTLALRDASGNFAAGTITANTIGTHTGNVTGSAATVTNAAQPNITSLGTLTSLAVSGSTTFSNSVTIGGNLTVNGTTTTINATTLDVADLNITVAKNASTAAAANGAGVTIAGANASMTYSNLTDSFVFNKRIDATSFYGSGAGLTSIPNSALTNSTITVTAGTGLSGGGTIALGGTVTVNNAGVTELSGSNGITVSGSTGAITVGSTATADNTASAIVARDVSGNFSANIITATATAAQYADLAEMYQSDAQYEPGTVLVFGGDYEVTTTGHQGDVSVAGVVSTAPAYLMNIDAKRAVPVALRGKVPVKVIGPVRKGDLLVTSYLPGYAISIGKDITIASTVAIFAKSVEEDLTDGQKLINAVII